MEQAILIKIQTLQQNGIDPGWVLLTEKDEQFAKWNKLKVAELKEECAKRGLTKRGNKQELIAKILTDEEMKSIDDENEDDQDLNHEERNIPSSQQQDIVDSDDETEELLETDSADETMEPEMSLQQAKLYEKIEKRKIYWTSRPLKVEELKTFFAVSLVMGLHTNSAIQDHWSTNPAYYNPWIASKMSRNRYLAIKRILHVDVLWFQDFFNTQFKSFWQPTTNMCFDETLFPFTGKIFVDCHFQETGSTFNTLKESLLVILVSSVMLVQINANTFGNDQMSLQLIIQGFLVLFGISTTINSND